MNTQENNIQMLSDILDQYENGEIVPAGKARKCYLTEANKKKNIVTWVHDNELQNHALLRRMSSTSARRDLLQNKKMC